MVMHMHVISVMIFLKKLLNMAIVQNFENI
jgi:hypothetical protein